MADRSAASLFADIFNYLAANPDERAKDMARAMWSRSGDYDFSPRQLYADEALLKLGLARMGVHPRYPEDGEQIVYEGEE